MSSRIEHSGVVTRTEDGAVHVTISSRSACGSCKAREACGLAEAQEKVVVVGTWEAAAYAPGERVVVGVRRRAGGIAVLLAYVGALVVLMAVLAVAVGPLGWTEGAAAAAALGGVALYYVVLWLFRRKIEHTIHFTITKI